MEAIDATLRVAGARRRLAVRREQIAIVDAALAGRPQTLIARLAGVSQPHVSRTLARVKRECGGQLRPLHLSALDVIDHHDAGEIDRVEMMRLLHAVRFTDGVVADVNGVATDAYRRGSWDDIEHAFQQEKLTYGEYSGLFAAHRERQRRATTVVQ